MVKSVADNTATQVQNLILWVLQIAAALMFLMTGFPKLAGAEQMVRLFNSIGIGQWFRYLTGLLEVLGAVGLLVPRWAGLAALLLACVMVGALVTHLFVVGGSPLMAIVLLVVTAIIAWGRRARTVDLFMR